MGQKIRVLIADNREIFREGLAKILQKQEHIEVVSKCSSEGQVVRKCREVVPDVVLIGASLSPRGYGVPVRQINALSSRIRVAVLTDFKCKKEMVSTLEAGATGYLSKDIKAGSLVESVDLIANGEVVISPPSAENPTDALTAAGADQGTNGTPLTERERETIRLLAKGASNKEVAEKLVITENTVKIHVKHILEKLQLRNRQQAAVYAVQQGLVPEMGDTGEKPD